MSRPLAGMHTVRAFLTRYQNDPPSVEREEICYEMATEIRAEINGLWAATNGAVSARPGKNETARREARIDGMKWMLGIALGLRMSDRQDVVDRFLEAFREARLNEKRSNR